MVSLPSSIPILPLPSPVGPFLPYTPAPPSSLSSSSLLLLASTSYPRLPSFPITESLPRAHLSPVTSPHPSKPQDVCSHSFLRIIFPPTTTCTDTSPYSTFITTPHSPTSPEPPGSCLPAFSFLPSIPPPSLPSLLPPSHPPSFTSSPPPSLPPHPPFPSRRRPPRRYRAPSPRTIRRPVSRRRKKHRN